MNAYKNATDRLEMICNEKSIPCEERNGLKTEIIDGRQVSVLDDGISVGMVTYATEQTTLRIRFWHWKPLYNEEAVSFRQLFHSTPEVEAEYDLELRSAVERLTAPD
ncbi:MAG: hypothetical protein IPG67_05035 [Acidobacteria bacterium]|nr:hypothetical protein [Acidobacteriota bacterium]MBK7933391.1 hypothetical protein [Acidobacteriota bacterium]